MASAAGHQSTAGHGRGWRGIGLGAALLLGLVAAPPAVLANDEKDEAAERGEALEASRDWLGGIPAAPAPEWEIGFGGRLYDDWWEALAVDEPEGTHPAYPAASQQKGAVTWRCKECHGWDYKGAGGAYAGGSHFTGIKGIQGMIGVDPRQIQRALRDQPHGFSAEQIPDEALERLALFVTRGQHEVDLHIDTGTKKARGDAANGERYFQNICAPCHGFDGKALNFSGDAANPEFIGTVAADNPWETLHKIRNGQPGQPMPALRVLPMQDSVDILTYAQTLPPK